MRLNDILTENKTNITEQYFKTTNRLVESVCSDMNIEQKRIVEGIYKEFKPLIEASLTADQIQKIFTDVEANATASGNNRTAVGKATDIAGAGVDAVKKANEIINKAGKWLQDTTPVKNFDAKFDKLKNDINTKFPDSKILDGISKMGMWAQENPGKTAAIIGLLTAIASLAGGPVGGAIAGQVLKGSVELLKGEKLSTAVGKGIKAAAVGWLAGKSMEAVGKMISGIYSQFNPIPLDATQEFYEVNIGNGLPSTYEQATFYGSKEQLGQFKNLWGDAVKQWDSGNFDGARTAFDQARKFAEKVSLDTMTKIAVDGDPADKVKQLNQALVGLSAAAQGAATGATGIDKQGKPTKESRELSTQQVKTIFEWCDGSSSVIMEGPLDAIKGAVSKGATAVSNKAQQVGKNLTTKVTADKLNKAWKAAGSPTNSDEVVAVLRKAGVSDDVLTPVFKTLKIKLPPATNVQTAKDQPVDAQPGKTDTTAQPGSINPAKATTASAKANTASQGSEQLLDYKSLQAAVAQLRTRDAQSLLKFIDGTTTPAPAKAEKPVVNKTARVAAAAKTAKNAGVDPVQAVAKTAPPAAPAPAASAPAKKSRKPKVAPSISSVAV